ncbi:MAG: hypothetical protein JNJ49_12490 [Bdellovibrionaceae bacterium]|nr:hypothetical protein [Pseudobdellovibrionaceae bacterium]
MRFLSFQKRRHAVLALIASIHLFGCGGGGGNGSASSPSQSGPGVASMQFSTTTTAWPGWCKTLTATLLNSSGATVSASTAFTASITTQDASVYSDSSCSTTISSIAVSAGSSTLTLYYKPTAVSSTLSVSLSHSSFTTSTYSGTSALPTAVGLKGQSNYSGGGGNGNGLSTGGLNEPRRMAIAGSKLFVADKANHRVVIYPSLTATAPDTVLGQADLTSNSGANPASASSFADPVSVWSDGTRLLVTSKSQNRILMWNTIPTTDATPADLVIGQASDSTTATGTGMAELDSPEHAFISGTKLFVVDGGNSRVLIFNTVPTATGAAADVQVGAFGSGNAADQFATPYFALVTGTKLLVADGGTNHRIQVFNTVPTAANAAADLSLALSNASAQPTALAIVGSKLLAYDEDKSRVVFWNAIPTSATSPDGVIGQADLSSVSTTVDDSTLGRGYGLLVDGTSLWVADTERHRLLKFTTPEP